VLTYGSRWTQIGPKYAYRREGSSCAEGAFAQSSSVPVTSWCCSARAFQVSRAAGDFEADSLVVLSTDGLVLLAVLLAQLVLSCFIAFGVDSLIRQFWPAGDIHAVRGWTRAFRWDCPAGKSCSCERRWKVGCVDGGGCSLQP
jgi:hypothetical protein